MVIDKDLINYMHPLIHSTKYRKFQSENEAQTLYLIWLRNEIKKKKYQYKFHDLYICTRKSQHLWQSFALSFQNYVIQITHKNNLDRVIDFSYLSSIFIRTWHWQIISPLPCSPHFLINETPPPSNKPMNLVKLKKVSYTNTIPNPK
jgi:hypothetical protein